jgi:prophage regulatory protein
MTNSRNAAAPTCHPAHANAIASQPLRLDATKSTALGVSLYRLKQVLARIPVSRSAWFAGVRTGRYPRSYSLGPRTTVWRSDDIDGVIASLSPPRDCLSNAS